MPPGRPDLKTAASRAWLESLRYQGSQTFSGASGQIDVSTSTATPPVTTITLSSNPVIPGTQSITIPTGTTAGRPSPTVGMIRYNTTLGDFEGYTTAGEWDNLASIKSKVEQVTPNPLNTHLLSYNVLEGTTEKILYRTLNKPYRSDITAHANVDTAETNLGLFSLDAGVFSGTYGNYIDIEGYGTYVGNANNKTVALYIGGTSVLNTGATAVASNGSWVCKVRVFLNETGLGVVGTFVATHTTFTAVLSGTINTTVTGLDLDAPIDIYFTGTSDTASDDVTQNGFFIYYGAG